VREWVGHLDLVAVVADPVEAAGSAVAGWELALAEWEWAQVAPVARRQAERE
jgi:hypothetical protein